MKITNLFTSKKYNKAVKLSRFAPLDNQKPCSALLLAATYF